MNSRTKVLQTLVRDGHYMIDESAVAEAVILRSMARQILPELSFRSAPPDPQIRSFRPHRGARSFRLSRADRRPLHRRDSELHPAQRA